MRRWGRFAGYLEVSLRLTKEVLKYRSLDGLIGYLRRRVRAAYLHPPKSGGREHTIMRMGVFETIKTRKMPCKKPPLECCRNVARESVITAGVSTLAFGVSQVAGENITIAGVSILAFGAGQAVAT